MATKAGWKRLESSLDEDSRAYKDFLDFCKKMGVDQATAVRLIIVAWSEAKHGELGQLWGFSTMPLYPIYPAPQPPVEQPAPTKPEKKKPNAAKAAVENLDLDL
jgi:hypothetical protein